MKKSNLILLASIMLLALTSVKSQAQVAMNNPRIPAAGKVAIYVKANSRIVEPRNFKAQKNFDRTYHHVAEAEWSTLHNKLLMCRFYMNNILYRAFFTAHGQWMYTVSGYDGSRLDKGVSDKIRSFYYNSRIVFVNQIDLVNGKTIYIVEIHDEKSIKKLRVDDDEMEIVQEFEKR